MINLNGLKILVTRPQEQGEKLCALIQAAAGEAVHFPTIEFKLTHAKIPALTPYDWLIFISPQAVYSTLHLLKELPTTLKVACVGKGTAQVLEQAGYKVDFYPRSQQGGDALLKYPIFMHCQNLKVVIIRGLGGREEVDRQLSLRGAEVCSIIAYERILPKVSSILVEKKIINGEINRIIATSYEGIYNLKILLADCWLELKKIPLIVVSERIKKLAIDLGYETIWVTKAVSDQSILQILAEKRG